MDRRTAICMFLQRHHKGKENAIHSKEIEKLFGISNRTVREYVTKLRKEGYPICSDNTGYYYANTQEEINETIKRLNEFITRVSNARTGMLYASVIEPGTTEIRIRIEIRGG